MGRGYLGGGGAALLALVFMSWTYGMGTNPTIDYVRLMVADTDSTQQIFQDEEISMAYAIDQVAMIIPQGQGVTTAVTAQPSARRAAANLLDSLAGDKSRLASIKQMLDVKLDSSDAAIQLRATAKEWRDIEADSGAFAITEMVNTQFAARERVWKQLLRIQGG